MHVEVGDWGSLGEAACAIRHQVFVEEQGVPVELEADAFDAVSLHVLAVSNGRPAGTGRLVPDGHLGRIAVLPAARGQGMGRLIVSALIDEARKAGHTCLVLHAQSEAVPFYEKLGFSPSGAVFMEAGIPHLAMWMSLQRG